MSDGRASARCASARSARLALLFAAIVLVSACGSASTSFDPTSPCGGAEEQRMPGAYPDLEATIPTALDGVAADARDSGRFCAERSLGSLWARGIREAHFAGGTWPGTNGAGLSLVTFEADGLTPDALFASYEAGARASAKVRNVATSRPTVAGSTGFRLDAINGDFRQVVVIWPGDRDGRVRVVLASDLAEDRVQAAIAAFH
jgi:hypothetical protein